MTDFERLRELLRELSKVIPDGNPIKRALINVDEMPITEILSICAYTCQVTFKANQIRDTFLLLLYNGADIETFVEETLKITIRMYKDGN